MFPKVSICIPVYQQVDYLLKVLESVFMQKYKEFELIVTDDSHDNSIADAISRFTSHPNLRYHKNLTRKGSPGNWNEAIHLASGKYIKILHHDDWFSNENSLSAFVKMLDDHPKADLAFSASNVCDANGGLQFVHCPTQRQILKIREDCKYLFLGNSIGSPSATIYRRENIDSIFDVNMKWLVDVDFYIRTLQQNPEFVFCSTPLICTTNDADHQITSECRGVKEVEIFEWLYLYQKLWTEPPVNFRRFRIMWNLFSRHGIISIDDVRKCKVHNPLSNELNQIIHYQKIFNVFRKTKLFSALVLLAFLKYRFM